jgi:ribosome-binding factor A
MIAPSRVSGIRHAQKEELFSRELSILLQKLSLDDPRVAKVFISNVKLAPDRKLCTVYLYSAEGKETVHEIVGVLILYAPSLRKALASATDQRFVPDLRFVFDERYEKMQRVEALLESISSK